MNLERPTDGLEKICLALVLSIAIFFYCAFFNYIWGGEASNLILLVILSIIFVVRYLQKSLSFFKSTSFYNSIVLIGAVFLYLLILLSLTKNFCGGGWYGDWFEHYQRTLFFTNRLHTETIFFNGYILPARPPLMHVVLSSFMHLDTQFALYQFLALVLNSLCLLGGLLFVQNKNNPVNNNQQSINIFLLLALSTPSISQSMVYGWPRPLTYFFVLVGIDQYIRFLNSKPYRNYTAIICLTLATLTHYSAVPYLIFVLLHYFVHVLKTRSFLNLKSFLKCILIFLLMFAPWLLWSIKNFGLKRTFLANSTAMGLQDFTILAVISKIYLNLRDTLVPHFFRDVNWNFGPLGSYEYWDNYFFLIYQPNFIFAFGSFNFILLCYVLSFKLLDKNQNILRYFWLPFVPFIIFLSVAVIGERDHFGLAHIGLNPIIILGLAFVANKFSNLKKWAKFVFVLGIVIDFLIGTVLHFYVQYTFSNNLNYQLKLEQKLIFFADGGGYCVLGLFVGFILLLAVKNKKTLNF